MQELVFDFGMSYEEQYMAIVQKIMEHGCEEFNEHTKNSVRRLPGQIIKVDLRRELPILKSKFVAFKTLTAEIFWIMVKQSNIVQVLRDMGGGNIWNAWEGVDGSIGKAYGYQIANYEQIDNVISKAKFEPSSRYMVVDMWNVADLDEMALPPCVAWSIYSVINGELHLNLIQRSGDMMVGVPFNTPQYAVLQTLIAKVCGLKVGTLTHLITDAHIYSKHFDNAKVQLSRAKLLKNLTLITDSTRELVLKEHNSKFNESLSYGQVLTTSASKPRIDIAYKGSNIYDYEPSDVVLKDYESLGKLPFELITF